MSRQKLSEYRAKKILIDNYSGVEVNLQTINQDIKKLLPDHTYVVKVDQGIKKRGKQGLIRLNVPGNEVGSAIIELAQRGFNHFLVEKMVPHQAKDEYYLSLERTRDGIVITYSPDGGVDIEESPGSLKTAIYPDNPTPLSEAQIAHIVDVMDKQHISLAEFNPFLKSGHTAILDAAVLVDSAGQHFADGWDDSDIMEASATTEEEKQIAALNHNSPAAFSFRLLNPNGSLWLLLSGGGASITIADQAHAHGMGGQIANYGEYSGGPTTEESYLYTRSLLSSMLKSKAPQKALVIAGSVANFTDVQETFKGVIQALDEVSAQLKKQKVKVFVRRGGPNEAAGLTGMEKFLNKHDLNGGVEGSSAVVTSAVDRALEYLS